MLTVTNLPMANALSSVAEVYYNVGTSTANLGDDFESKLNDAVKNKLIQEGIDPKYAKYVTSMDASANPATVTDETYVHKGKETWYMGNQPQVETENYNHVQISNNGKALTFYGYTQPGYKDYMLTSGSPSGKKIITFDMDESKVDYHSMEGGGFLFNTKIDNSGKLSGYAILYEQDSITVYEINGVDAMALHNEEFQSNMYPLLLGSIPGVSLVKTYSKGDEWPSQHSIKIVATIDKLNMWDNGEQIFKDEPLSSDMDGNEFGPFVSHKDHDCGIISIFAYDNMKLFSTSEKDINVAVNEINWDPYAPYRYVVNINDDPRKDLDKDNVPYLGDILVRDEAHYVGVTDAAYKQIEEEFVQGLPGGLHIDINDPDFEMIIDPDILIKRIAEGIVEKVIEKKDAVDAIEAAEKNVSIQYELGDSKSGVRKNLTFLPEDDDITWYSDDTSTIAPDGTVTRPVLDQKGKYVNLTAKITKGGLTSEKTFTVYVLAADPGKLTSLSATPGNGEVTLKFPPLKGAADGDIVVEMSTDGKEFAPVTPKETLNASSTSATVTGLTNGKTYHFRLNVKSGFYLGESNVATATPTAPPVTTPPATTPSAPAPSTPPAAQPTMKTDVVVSDQANGGKVVQDKITKLIGDSLKVTGKIKTANGKELNLPNIVMNQDGSFTLPKVAPGEYKLSLNVIAPNGEKLAGPAGTLVVDSKGNASLKVDLVDPYGTILDSVTNQPVSGVNMQLYWADTELNRAKGRKPGTVVNLPELPDFSPNKNHNPQASTDEGQYGWMVYADGDYYFLGEKNGYIVFDSRNDKREESFGDDSYVKDGIIHVGDTIVKFSFSAQPKVKAAGDHSAYMVGYPDGTFKADRGIVRAEVAAILSRLYTPEAKSTKVSYSDVSANYWAVNAITTATSNKWMVGSGKNTFKPKQQITRAEFAQILMNLYKWDAASESTYSDIKGHWAEQAIASAEKQGLLFDFTGQKFNPNQPITRLEVVRIFNELLGRKPWLIKVDPKWSDVSVNHSNYSDIMEASIPHAFEQFETGVEDWKK
ncbi:S-layer homology domain-containing protein [Paenibacillus sp. Marseille-P2973]|uniref:S-layer homology domain-containing protein n=1 Tax=Paenibacillus sp. Marseille-P2973 TaxID=1871032 RepID=UPI001FFCBC57|nr:S-layer homology domain-containing protein [Paenibacillus sp. Marseille-P2973]